VKFIYILRLNKVYGKDAKDANDAMDAKDAVDKADMAYMVVDAQVIYDYAYAADKIRGKAGKK
jgi:hypothetical protein